MYPRASLYTARHRLSSRPASIAFHASKVRPRLATVRYNSSSRETRPPLHRRVADAWNNTPIKWYPLPIGVGALLLAVLQLRKRSEQERQSEAGDSVRLTGPWQVHVLGALPLRNLSRLWGYLNSLELPVWFRPTGFRLYGWVFGCNLDEIDPKDLKSYASLGEFFYRKLQDDARPIENSVLVSPADGTILHFGTIQGARVEQVKGLTYSLDALLGTPNPTDKAIDIKFAERDPEHAMVEDKEFANVNGIEYTLDRLIGRGTEQVEVTQAGEVKVDKTGDTTRDAAVPEHPSDTTAVVKELGVSSVPPMLKRRASISDMRPENELYFAVIYLAPGDYHRFHSPAAWVVEKRRHFAGELFSVSPYIAQRLANLFVLNERVVLLGRWRHGFFSMIPVGATNVGSIQINFDKDLRTNERKRLPPAGTFTEALYTSASTLLRGQPLTAGQEMGGFKLGSTIVLVFEAPKDFKFDIHAGQKVKVGQRLGDTEDS